MKKFKLLGPILLATIIGIYLGKVIYVNYQSNLELAQTFNSDNNAYFLQQGIYSNIDSMNENTKNLSDYIYVLDDNKYKVFIGISSNKETSQKVKDIYTDKGVDIYIKDINIQDNSFYQKLKEYDKLIDNSNDINEILEIENQIMKEYEVLMHNE